MIIVARVCFRVKVVLAVHSHLLLSRKLRWLDIVTHRYEGRICLLFPILENTHKDGSQDR